MPETFDFQGFKVYQNTDGLKVNTDGVLLGAWTSVLPKERVLEIGSGTGLISAILAHKFPENFITAIELNPQAIQSSAETFNNHWNRSKMKLIEGDFLEMPADKYDVFVSNPPYYNTHPGDSGLQLAKHQSALNYHTLISKCSELAHSKSRLYLILPEPHWNEVQYLLLSNGWYIGNHTGYSDGTNEPAIRCLIEATRVFKFQKFEHFELFTPNGSLSKKYKSLVAHLYKSLPSKRS